MFSTAAHPPEALADPQSLAAQAEPGKLEAQAGSKGAAQAVPIAACDVEMPVKSAVYTGSEIRLKPRLSYGGAVLEEGRDYGLSYFDNVEVGIAEVRISGRGDFKSLAATTFTIVQADLASASVAAIPSCIYNGKAATPKPVLTLGGYTLKANTDYYLSYGNNLNAGTARIEAHGCGSFYGEKVISFAIERAPLSEASVAVPDVTYTGFALAPAPSKAVYKSLPLKEGRDYAVAYKNNVKAGTAQAIFEGAGNYKGSKTVSFTVKQANIADAAFKTLAAQTFTGKAHAPQPTITFKSKALAKGTDFKLAFRNNVYAGTASVDVTGAGSFTGKKTLTFKIAKAANPLVVKNATKKVSFKKVKKSAQTFKPACASKAKGTLSFEKKSGSGKLTLQKTTGKVTVAKGVKKGTYAMKVAITARGTADYNAATKTAKITVKVG